MPPETWFVPEVPQDRGEDGRDGDIVRGCVFGCGFGVIAWAAIGAAIYII